jgi:transcriptional regulator with XRE-family HTH domain
LVTVGIRPSLGGCSGGSERNLTQEQLGEFIGVYKAQISKLESCTNNATIDTILKIFKA